MYSNKDLEWAVSEGIFSPTAISEFRQAKLAANSPAQDTVKSQPITKPHANDIFVVMGCWVLLFGALWTLKTITATEGLGALILFFSGVSTWCLAKVFERKRQWAILAIALWFSLVSSILGFCIMGLL